MAPKLADSALLDMIDKLMELNLGDSVPLPQLLVVGDQSSGRSSVLEGFTDLAFPRDSGLCTRYATQITFRRTKAYGINMSVIPGADSSDEHRNKVREWKATDITKLGNETFTRILKEVNVLMGIGSSSEGKATFSDDMLKIEVCGPKQDHLSVVDVPGIFRRQSEGVTTKADMETVRNMVKQHMENPRSVILAVIPANVDIATQEILEMAEAVDNDGRRTLGILTKPDLVDIGAEHNVVDLLEGRSHKLKLGWYLVRNLGQKDLQNPVLVKRNDEEKKFFTTRAPWSTLDQEKLGVESLRLRLHEVLHDIVHGELGSVRNDVSRNLRISKEQLKALGESRETRQQQHLYLLDMASRFQKITDLALKAQYGGDDLFESISGLKLATAVVDRNEKFSEDIYQNGHKYRFKRGLNAQDGANTSKAIDEQPNTLSDTEFEVGKYETVNVRYFATHPGLDEVKLFEGLVTQPSNDDILVELERMYRYSRGLEIGTFDAQLVPIVWKAQSTKWKHISQGYISDMVTLVHVFIITLLSSVCADDRVRRSLMSNLMNELTLCYQKAINHARFILKVERDGTPMTLNHYFADNLEKSRQERQQASLKAKSSHHPDLGDVISLSDLKATQTASNPEHIVQDLHDILKSYYKVARKRFVDVVCMQAADYHLVTGPHTPVRVFSPTFVSCLTPEQLEKIAGEDSGTKRKRVELEREITKFEEARKVLIW